MISEPYFEGNATSIYANMDGDWSEAIDSIREADWDTVWFLFLLLTLPAKANTDVELNSLFIPIVLRRLSGLGHESK